MKAAAVDMDVLIATAMECQKKVGASDADIADLMDKEMPTTQSGSSMRKCILEETGWVISIKRILFQL